MEAKPKTNGRTTRRKLLYLVQTLKTIPFLFISARWRFNVLFCVLDNFTIPVKYIYLHELPRESGDLIVYLLVILQSKPATPKIYTRENTTWGADTAFLFPYFTRLVMEFWPEAQINAKLKG